MRVDRLCFLLMGPLAIAGLQAMVFQIVYTYLLFNRHSLGNVSIFWFS